jgi:hypothetical protein
MSNQVSDYIKDLQQKNAERARASGLSIPSKDETQPAAAKGKKESSSKSTRLLCPYLLYTKYVVSLFVSFFVISYFVRSVLLFFILFCSSLF